MGFRDLLKNLPEVKAPTEKKVPFNTAIKWTIIVLITYFILANIPVYGISEGALSQFEYLAILLATDFGSIISLGIGPIVMASIVLQLLVGSKIIDIDLNDKEGKRFYQSLQKLLTFGFILFEACVYVLLGGIPALPGYTLLVIFQLCLGGLLIVFLDEVVDKWGIGSGVSLFIAAGIGARLFSQLFQFMGPTGTFEAAGKVWQFINSIIIADSTAAILALYPIIITAILFFVVVFAQSLKVEIPLSYDRIRGYGVRWPLPFFYSGVIPVILVSSFVATVQLFAKLLENALGYPTILGGFSGQEPISGLAFWIHSNEILRLLFTGGLRWEFLVQAVCHVLFYTVFSIIFAYFWVITSGMDARSQAEKIVQSGLSIPGFRRDERVLETILNRYIPPLTIMGGAAIGLLASISNLFGALVGGTAILLAIMITYQFYQNIAQKYALEMNPGFRKFFEG